MPDVNVTKKKEVSPFKRALFWTAIAFVIGFNAYRSPPGIQTVASVLIFTKTIVGATYAVPTFIVVLIWRLFLTRIEPRSHRAYVFLSFAGPAIVGLLFLLLIGFTVAYVRTL